LDKFAAGKFDVVLTDNSMPVMTGKKMVVEIRKIDPIRR